MTIFTKGILFLGGGFVFMTRWGDCGVGVNTTLTDEVEVLSALKKNSTCRNDAKFELFLPTKQAS